MWFKQIQLFQLTRPVTYDAQKLEERLATLAFSPCLPSLFSSHGFASPFEHVGEDAPLVHAANGFLLFCMQIEDKILPSTVIRQALDKKVKKISAMEERKVTRKEKSTLKDEVTFSLLPRAFSRMSRIYAYIDTKHNLLVIDNTIPSKVEKLMSLLKKAMGDNICRYIETNNVAFQLTQWLQHGDAPKGFTIDKSCILRDPQNQSRVINCQQQDLNASAIQSLIKDGCEVFQLGLTWQERISFKLTSEFTLKTLRYDDVLLGAAKDLVSETPEQQFDSDFFIMTESLTDLIQDLMQHFEEKAKVIGKTESELAAIA